MRTFRHIGQLFLAVAVAAAYLFVLSRSFGDMPSVGDLLDPGTGVYASAREATYPTRDQLQLAVLEEPVTVLRDRRGVPHIFAASDRDAVVTMGYLVASDRLFQLDFLPRIARGRLAAVFGPSAVDSDRFLRSTGMNWGIEKNARRIREEQGIEYELMQWYAAGVNAYLEDLPSEKLPVEFQLMGYRPEKYTIERVLGILQYMAYDLTYQTDDSDYSALRARIGGQAFEKLYPNNSRLFSPIIPPEEPPGRSNRQAEERFIPSESTRLSGSASIDTRQDVQPPFLDDVPGKGSNNWGVQGEMSATGAPILAGDMHLQLRMPSIWYEVHLVTPSMNVYGVTVPGAPLPIEAYNEHLGWTFTNTGADQIDHYALKLDSTGTRYRYLNDWRDLELVPDTLEVKGADPIVDTLRYSHWGPVRSAATDPHAIQWTAHDTSTTLQALWHMNRAASYEEFEEALRHWDTPVQNILYADADSNLAIRTTGYVPVRRAGHGKGLLDGSARTFDWTGRIPFEEMPHVRNPSREYLFSANQQPVGSRYTHYLNHNWQDGFRSLRIDSLLTAGAPHTVADLQEYQGDVHVVQHDLFLPLIDTLEGLSPRADTLRQMLVAWDGKATKDRPETSVFYPFLTTLEDLAWDELTGYRRPELTQLWYLLREEPSSRWLDRRSTDRQETADDLLRMSLEAAVDSLTDRYGWNREKWRWGDHHQLLLPHITGSETLRPLGRGPFEYPGFFNTVSPAEGYQATHSASWRIVVDFSSQPPRGYGVYPGGQHGNPFSPWYDKHMDTYLSFNHYRLYNPAVPDSLPASEVRSHIRFEP